MTVTGTAAAGTRAATPLDLRLAVGAATAWLTVVGCLDSTATVTLGVALAALVLGGGCLAVGEWRPREAGLLAAAALACWCAAMVLLPLAGRIDAARASPLAAAAGHRQSVSLELTLRADPRPLAATGPGGAPRVAVETEAERIGTGPGSRTVAGAVLVLGDAGPWRDLLPGQRVRVEGALSPDLSGGALSVTLFARRAPERLGSPPWWQRAAGTTRAALRSAVGGLPADVQGLLPGLVDGDVSALDPVLAEHFRTAGLTHLVAVSGTNCSLLVGAVLLVLRRSGVRPWVSALAGGIVVAMFVVIARPSPSVLRAALMAVIGLVALAGGRPRSAVPALSAVVIALLLWDPTLAASASFTMSVLATAALLMIAPGWASALRLHGVPCGLAESIAVAAAAHLVTAPVIAALSGQVSVVAVAANVLAEPVVAVTTVLGFTAAVVAPGWLVGGAALAWLAGWPCRWLVGVAEFFGGLAGATLPWPAGAGGGFALLGVGAVVWLLAVRAGPRRALTAAGLTAIVVLVPVRSVTWPWPGRWVFAACDVGQGDALVLNAGPHTAVTVDAGPDPVPVDRCLRDLDVTSLPLVVLTHFHVDHVAGLAGLARGRRIGAVISGPLDAPEYGGALAHRFARAHRDLIRVPRVGSRITVGAVTLEVLGPAHSFHGSRSDPNNSSLVLRATVGGVRILLPGDAEIEAQQALVRSGVDLSADVLKVAHHGSAYFAPGFLSAVAARLAVVSVGLHNDYGHPSPLLLSALARRGTPVLRTDRDGDVAVVRSGNGTVRALVRGSRRAAAEVVGAVTPPRQAVPLHLSALGARMAPCLLAPSPPTTCPAHCPACCSSSATRSCSSTGPSARSPPPRAAPILTWSRPSVRAASSRAPSCTSCSDRRCSGTPACSWCGPRRTSGWLPLPS